MNPTRSLNILVVDDEEIVRETLTAIIDFLGHTIELVNDGFFAKERLSGKDYDVAFFDMRMPGLDGMDLLAWCRHEKPHLPVIIMSGHGPEAFQEEALQAGAYKFIKKPFSIEEIKGLLVSIAKKKQ